MKWEMKRALHKILAVYCSLCCKCVDVLCVRCGMLTLLFVLMYP